MKSRRSPGLAVPLLAVLLGTSAVTCPVIFSGHAMAESAKPAADAGKIMSREAANFMQELSQRALQTIGNTDLDKSQMRRKFAELLSEGFDMPTIAKMALGGYWRSMPAEQRTEYTNLFQKFVVAIYADRLGQSSNQKFEILANHAETERDSVVSSRIIPGGKQPSINVDWRIRKMTDGSFKIIDVSVEGISMVRTQRDDFASTIERGGGVDALIASLKQRTQGL